MEAVGISCWWFASRQGDQKTKDEFDPSSHIAEIKRALESVENLSNLTVEADGSIAIAIPGDGDEDKYNNFFPMFYSLRIAFDLFLPLRVQQKYNILDRRLDEVENFHIKIIGRRPMPIAYIHYTVTGSEANAKDFTPSTVAMIVRMYLEEKLRDNAKVDFQSLGPSPFHAEIFLHHLPESAPEAPKDLTNPGAGYRTLFFPTVSNRPNAQVAELVARYHGTLRSFYTVVRRRNYAQQLARAVTDGSLGLLQLPERKGRWATFQHWRGYRVRIDQVFTALLHEKLNRVRQVQLMSEIEEDETILRSGPLYPLLQREMRDAAQMPDEDIRELLVMLEERRRGYFENAATLFSGLVGGILGALLGAALTFGLADHSESKILKKDNATITNSKSEIPANADPKAADKKPGE